MPDLTLERLDRLPDGCRCIDSDGGDYWDFDLETGLALLEYARERAARERCLRIGRTLGDDAEITLYNDERDSPMGDCSVVLSYDAGGSAPYERWAHAATPTLAYIALGDALEAQR